MRSPHVILFLLLLVFSIGCHPQNCNEINTDFSTYDQVIKTVRNASFKLSEEINTYKSSWMDKAGYYSCDGEIGYFIMTTKGKSYIYQNMPLEVWVGFKEAESYGRYYNRYIKGKYILEID